MGRIQTADHCDDLMVRCKGLISVPIIITLVIKAACYVHSTISFVALTAVIDVLLCCAGPCGCCVYGAVGRIEQVQVHTHTHTHTETPFV